MSEIDKAFLKPYSPKDMEDSIYALWEKSGFFNPDKCVKKGVAKPDAKPYTIVLPPPNVTGTLHMGHAAMLAVEDILIRYQRMLGKRALWIPGTDHAAIATQSKVEDILYKKEKKTRHDLGREVFLSLVEKFAQENHDNIVNQVKKLGSSIDWSREAFTLDEKRSLAVQTAFKHMYDNGLIYRGARIVNWDPELQTTISDDEVERKEKVGKFYYLKYGPFVIGTARPETKFGDKYVVMHPDDARYEKYKHGERIEVEWINGPITATIIKDDAVNMELGTGVMTITPWHDSTDFEIAERHNLDKEQIIDFNGKLLPIAEEFSGMHIKKARDKIVEKLEKKGLVERVDDKHAHSLATNSRGGAVVEPQIKEQWFVAVNREFKMGHSEISGVKKGDTVTLKKLMYKAVGEGDITILPKRFEKTYHHWIYNLRDWCISRQMWYGHRIPVWYHEKKCIPIPGREEEVSECEMLVVSTSEPKCKHCNAKYIQDPDTLDTWFSSGLWTFSTLGWPEDTEDLKTYHPTDVLETGYDILFFWVARMILMSGYHLGTIPFHTVYLHGLVRDEQGKKMSKSLGNVIDPLDMIEKFGADAVRLSLVVGAAPGNDIRLSENKVRGYKHFANKLWNIARFVLEYYDLAKKNDPSLNPDDNEIIKETTQKVAEVSNQIEQFRFDLAIGILYPFVWSRYASEIIEESKSILKGSDETAACRRAYALMQSLEIILKLLHPFMPFVTEAIWQKLPVKDSDLLMVAKWPKI